MEGPGPARGEPPPTVAVGPFQRRPEPPEEELYRLGMGCRAGKAAACREYALIHLPSEPDTRCEWIYKTDDPNGPVAQIAPWDHRQLSGHEKPACKPPEYRHLGPCGDCLVPRIHCRHRENGEWVSDGDGPFGKRSSRCPAGELCTGLGVCFPKADFPVERHHLPRDEKCWLDRECASHKCNDDGWNAFGSVGICK